MSQPRILITGGAGKAGHWIVKHFLEQGYDVTNVDSRPPSPELKCHHLTADLTDLGATIDAFSPHSTGNRTPYVGVVHMAAIQSPRIQQNDVKRLAANKSMPDGVIRFIANNRDWTKHYDVMLSLVNNPKTPLADAMSFLNHLRSHDLRQLQRNRNVPQQLARQAKSMTLKRGQ